MKSKDEIKSILATRKIYFTNNIARQNRRRKKQSNKSTSPLFHVSKLETVLVMTDRRAVRIGDTRKRRIISLLVTYLSS